MKLGFVSAILADLSFAEVMEFAAAEDFDCVEVMCWPVGKAERRYAGVTHIDVQNLDVAAVQKVVKDTGVAISGLGYYPNALSASVEERTVAVDQIRRVIGAAAELGIGQMNTFIGRDPAKSVDDNWPLFLETWPSIVEEAAAANVNIGIENCPMFFSSDEWPGGKNLAHSPAVWRRMFDAIPSANFGLNYDPSHLVWQMMDPVAPLWEFKDRLHHAHAKDARVDRHRLNEVGIMANPLQYHQPKLPGLGEVNWGQFFSVLGDVGYTGAVCIEVEDRPYESSLEGRKDALRQSARYLRQFLSRRGF
jgi:sugar phosphate isomerase/epimerase